MRGTSLVRGADGTIVNHRRIGRHVNLVSNTRCAPERSALSARLMPNTARMLLNFTETKSLPDKSDVNRIAIKYLPLNSIICVSKIYRDNVRSI